MYVIYVSWNIYVWVCLFYKPFARLWGSPQLFFFPRRWRPWICSTCILSFWTFLINIYPSSWEHTLSWSFIVCVQLSTFQNLSVVLVSRDCFLCVFCRVSPLGPGSLGLQLAPANTTPPNAPLPDPADSQIVFDGLLISTLNQACLFGSGTPFHYMVSHGSFFCLKIRLILMDVSLFKSFT